MDKNSKKNKKYTYDQTIIKSLVIKYGLTSFYIRQCLSGHSTSITADKINADYKELEKAMQETIEKFNNKV